MGCQSYPVKCRRRLDLVGPDAGVMLAQADPMHDQHCEACTNQWAEALAAPPRRHRINAWWEKPDAPHRSLLGPPALKCPGKGKKRAPQTCLSLSLSLSSLFSRLSSLFYLSLSLLSSLFSRSKALFVSSLCLYLCLSSLCAQLCSAECS